MTIGQSERLRSAGAAFVLIDEEGDELDDAELLPARELAALLEGLVDAASPTWRRGGDDAGGGVKERLDLDPERLRELG